MAKNFLAKKIDEAYNQGFAEALNKGIAVGMQFVDDIYKISLNNPDVMGKDVFGKNRLAKLHKYTEELVNDAFPAINASDPESDVWRDKLDKRLQKVMGDKFDPFEVRYPHLKEIQYGGKKK